MKILRLFLHFVLENIKGKDEKNRIFIKAGFLGLDLLG
jgi:hypothetical protein